MMRLTLESPGQLKLIEERSPDILPGTVKVRVSACGICGSDIAQWKGHRSDRYFGHEFTGIITEVGPGVKDLYEGMRVTSGMIGSCGVCWNCQNGHPNYCRNLHEILTPGGFAEETLVEHSDRFKFLTLLPSEIDDVTGTLHETISCVLRIIERAEIKPGQSVLVVGLGAIGVLAAELFRGLGAGIVVGMDLNPHRLAAAHKLKIDKVIDRSNQAWLEQIFEAVGPKGADIIIEATGSPKALGDSFQAARVGAKVIIGSVYHDLANNLDIVPIMRKELAVIGAKGSYPYVTSYGQSIATQTLLSGHFSTKEYFGVYSPQEAEQAFEDAASGRFIKPVIKFSQ
ncbi:zinc-dependent alcohol dehydrogenase [Priestia megaterium]|uniref:zinc-dependent alcohol dehydrogenase n=1 Tax=Priestia megaterium TaxID=1404 RepID=UPI002A6AEA2A|nr:alcohol dehydrogenase catalytic domain-containing protein [Priestia megaterium]MDY0943822.1 alcohol dehydrogenase catalytic domain-containing protein [Priestia megaterium]